MTTATENPFAIVDAPPDELPSDYTDTATGPFTDLYPDSTPEAPYGYKSDGTPFKRHHGAGRRSSGPASSGGRLPAGKQAETAAALLARLNSLMGLGFIAAGMPLAAVKLSENNGQFEAMAREALATDPALCKKILSAGATSGKAGLVMAYVMLGVSVVPAARAEYRENHPKEIADEYTS